jgi:RNA polymerase-binding transcription factor DksA
MYLICDRCGGELEKLKRAKGRGGVNICLECQRKRNNEKSFKRYWKAHKVSRLNARLLR